MTRAERSGQASDPAAVLPAHPLWRGARLQRLLTLRTLAPPLLRRLVPLAFPAPAASPGVTVWVCPCRWSQHLTCRSSSWCRQEGCHRSNGNRCLQELQLLRLSLPLAAAGLEGRRPHLPAVLLVLQSERPLVALPLDSSLPAASLLTSR